MWSAPLHNREFVKEMLEHVEDNKKDFATHERIKGMLTVALNVRALPTCHVRRQRSDPRAGRRNARRRCTFRRPRCRACSTPSARLSRPLGAPRVLSSGRGPAR